MYLQRKEDRVNKQEHDELLVYLESFVQIATEKIWGYDRFMSFPYLKLCNDTMSELLVIDATEAGI